MQPFRLRPHVSGLVAQLLLALLPCVALAQVTLARPSTTTAVRLSTTPPAGPPPSDVRVSPTPNSVHLRWTCPTGTTGYEIFATAPGGAQVKLTPAPIAAQCFPDVQVSIRQDPRLPVPTATNTTPTYSASFDHTGLPVGAEYTYVVRALYAGGVSDAAPVTAVTPPWPAPASVTVSVSPSRSGIVGWSLVSGASGYQVFRKLASETAFLPIATLGPMMTSYDDRANLPPGAHQYYVQPVSGVASTPVTLSVGPWPAPQNVRVAEQGPNTTLTWDHVRGSNAYLVFRQLQGEGTFRQVTPSPLNYNGFVEQNLPRGQTHRYYVQAVNGDPSAPVSILSGAPTALSVESARGSSTVTFRWNGASGATVLVTRGASAQGPFYPVAAVIDPATSSARDNAATVGATQYYRLQFNYPTGAAQSDVQTVTIAAPPKGVTGLSARALGGGSVKLTWACDFEANGYNIMRGKNRESMDWIRPYGSTTPLVVTTCDYTDTNLFTGATYTYRVVGRYGVNTVAPDGVASVVVQ